MSGLGTRLWLYGAALATGSAFSILFTGETYDGADGGFGALSVVTVIAGHKALLPMFFAAPWRRWSARRAGGGSCFSSPP